LIDAALINAIMCAGLTIEPVMVDGTCMGARIKRGDTELMVWGNEHDPAYPEMVVHHLVQQALQTYAKVAT
jgi:hypothetical protein